IGSTCFVNDRFAQWLFNGSVYVGFRQWKTVAISCPGYCRSVLFIFKFCVSLVFDIIIQLF
ncbi:MAG: hypothetical protein ACW99J_19095, partial [Candidatus Thorarchaeota archaeon]